MHRQVNFYIGALMITVCGAVATLAITRTAAEVESLASTEIYSIEVPKDPKTP
jgi:hypothetical protein